MSVSIIIPVYNARRYLRRTAGDLLRQSFFDMEVIFVDDGSTDGSGDLLDELAKKDRRIRVIHQKNGGTACARNKGIASAAGTYLMFMDDDDRIPRTYVEEFVSAMEGTDADLVIGGYRRITPDGRVLFTRRLIRSRSHSSRVLPDDPKRKWLAYINISPWSKIYLRSFVEKCGARFLEYPYGEDIYFQMMLQAAGPKIRYSSAASYGWVDQKESISNTIHKGLREEADIFPMLEKVLEVHPQRDEFFRYFLYRHCAYHLYVSGKAADPQSLTAEFRRCRSWLRKNQLIPKISPFSPRLEGEILRDRLAVMVIRLVSRFHLESLFARVYARGKRS